MPGRLGSPASLPGIVLPRAPVSLLLVTCAACRRDVLEADEIGDEDECALRDHLLAVHPTTVQPMTRTVLLQHFVVTEAPSPARGNGRNQRILGPKRDSLGPKKIISRKFTRL